MATSVPHMSVDGGPTIGDPPVHDGNGPLRPQHRKPHDPAVTFEEYYYYAAQCRAEEDHHHGSVSNKGKGLMATIFPSKSDKGVTQVLHSNGDEKETHSPDGHRMDISDNEWTNASRAVRVATGPACFYLITTDILGPFGLPFAIGTTGWGPGIVLYTIFGVLAAYSGYLIWKMFLGLDSYQYPLKTYGDLAFRIYGRVARHGINILQSIQLLCNVGVIVIGNGQALSQVAKFKLCFAICCLVWALVGFFVGQIRTLQKYGWLANAAIWMNVFVIFMTMGVAANSGPNYLGAQNASAGAASFGPGNPTISQLPDGSYPPVTTTAGLPNPGNFVGAVNGLMQAVYAYGGAMLFTEFMSEMKRPRDFLKAMWAAQIFIWFFYMLYGCFMYGYQGQYVINPAYQGIAPYTWQTVGNVISMVSAIIAAGLYGNIGIKVLYNNIFIDFFKAPPLNSKGGKILWFIIVPIYWSIAFIIAAAIPNFFGLTSVVAAFCILQFTYTFPPWLYLGYSVRRHALQDGEGFNPSTGTVTHHVTGFKRHMRGFGKRWYNHIWLIVYFLGALVTAGLGAYSGIESLIASFQESKLTSFTCTSPLAG